MIGIVVSMLASTWIMLAGFAEFSSSSFFMLRKDFVHRADANTTTACLAYGDLLARADIITTGGNSSTPNFTQFDAGCLVWESGVCIERQRCKITITANNMLNVTIN